MRIMTVALTLGTALALTSTTAFAMGGGGAGASGGVGSSYTSNPAECGGLVCFAKSPSPRDRCASRSCRRAHPLVHVPAFVRSFEIAGGRQPPFRTAVESRADLRRGCRTCRRHRRERRFQPAVITRGRALRPHPDQLTAPRGAHLQTSKRLVFADQVHALARAAVGLFVRFNFPLSPMVIFTIGVQHPLGRGGSGPA